MFMKLNISLKRIKLDVMSDMKGNEQVNIRYSDWLPAGRPKGRSSSSSRVKNFLYSTSARAALGPTQPLIQWVPGALYPEVKQPGPEADHSPQTSAEVKKMWIYASTPPYDFMA
jgi:hypothetical protein